MRRKIVTIISLAVMAAMATNVVAQNPDMRHRVADVEDMLERGRWGDAQELLLVMEKDVDPIAHALDREWIEFQKVRCGVELGDANAEAMMQNFVETYPSSIHRNSVLFMLASYYVDNGDVELANATFDNVEYKALSADERVRYDVRVGYIRFAEGDYYRARTHFAKVPKQHAYYPHALYYISYINYHEGDYKVAYEGFKQLVGEPSYDALVPYYIMQIEYRWGNHDYVIAEGEKLLSISNSATRDDLLRIIAESYFIKGDYAQSVRYISAFSPEKMGRQENYILGYSLYRMTRYSDAASALAKVCGADDALTQNAAYHLGDCCIKLGDKARAADAFALACNDSFDADIAQESLLNYGRLKYELGGGIFSEAVYVLQNYLTKYPGSPRESEVKSLLIAAYYNANDYDAAYIALREYPNPDNEIRMALQRVALLRAVKAVERGELSMAKQLLDESISIGLQPKYSALALFWQGEVAVLEGDMNLALEKFEAYVRRAPKSEVEYQYANYGIGYANFALDKMSEAAEAFEDFVRDYTVRDSYLYDAHNRLGDARFSMREFGAARNAYKVVVASSAEERHYARYQLAMLEGVEKKSSKKVEMLKAIIADGEGDYVDDAWYELGRNYISMERYADGAATLQEFVDGNTTSPYYISAMTDLALAYYNLGRKSEAVACYEKVVEYDPQSASALDAIRGLREIYVAEGKVNEYFDYAERSGVQSDMTSAARDSLTFAAAKNAYLSGDMSDARAKLDDYLKQFDKGYNRTEALFYLSDCHINMADNESALLTMEELLANGNNTYTERVLNVYACMTFDMERYDKSSKAYRRLYDVASFKDVRAVASEGYVEATMLHGDRGAVVALYDDVAQMADATRWARRTSMLAKANVLLAEGNNSAAMPLFEELALERTTAEGAEAYYRLIEARYVAGEYEQAQEMVYSMGECGSMYWQAKIYILLGDTFVKTNNLFQAQATYQSIVDGYSIKTDGIIDETKARLESLAKK
jgi:TolA-binding protein